ncbi:Uncharacterised protein [Mycobacteroides abscessus subsp. abscessus]|nr:Uncharacterised protein [Mycobacteroides abscessus subsp. abscessus]
MIELTGQSRDGRFVRCGCLRGLRFRHAARPFGDEVGVTIEGRAGDPCFECKVSSCQAPVGVLGCTRKEPLHCFADLVSGTHHWHLSVSTSAWVRT